MTYNLILQKTVPGYELKLYDLASVEWGKPTTHRYYLEKWLDDHALPPQAALVEKREYKTRNSAMNQFRKWATEEPENER